MLGVKPNATCAEIQVAFGKLADAYNSDPGRVGSESAKAVLEAYRVLRDPARRKEYDALLDWIQSPVKDGAISEQEFRSWLEAGKISEGIKAKIEMERLRREKEQREKEQKEQMELAKQQRADEARYAAWRRFGLLLIAILGIGALWLLVTVVRYFWTHPLF